jgi:crossover junction endodeoxyribonuclease RuvC
MRVLCLDLSLNGSGMAVIEVEEGRVRIKHSITVDNKKIPTDRRGLKLVMIGNKLADVIEDFTPDVIVRERGFSKFANETQALYRVVGVSEYILESLDRGLSGEYAPTSVKKAVVGSGKASKTELARLLRDYLVKDQYDYVFGTNNESDAVAVGITYLLDNKIIEEIIR